MPRTIGLIGGTGPEGRGLAMRFALAGHTAIIGSRDAARGEGIAREVREALGERAPGEVRGGANTDAARAGLVVVTVPYEGHRATLEALRDELAGRVVVDAVVPLRFERGPRHIDVPEGSATEEAAAVLPESRVVGAFHNLSATLLGDPDARLDGDVLVTGNDREAKEEVLRLVGEIEGLRGVDAGPLRFSRYVEQLTVLLIGVNGRYKAHTHPKILGLSGHERRDG